MRNTTVAWLSLVLVSFGAVGCSAGEVGGTDDAGKLSSELFTGTRVPGLVMGLQHNQNQVGPGSVMYSAFASEATQRRGGDLGATRQRGFEWWSLPDTGGDPAALRLPPGVVVALKHSSNQASLSITAFGRNPVSGTDFPGFRRQNGGDRGASSGVGYYWYESTGAGFTNWSGVDALLPKYTVVGLKHAANQASKVLVWNGVTYDPAASSASPPGFRRVIGGDIGAPAGQGYYWFEKISGEEIVTAPTLTVSLSSSLRMGASNTAAQDKDQDCLVDEMEAQLASLIRPHVTFDSDESARSAFEPVTVFRLYPTSSNTVHIRWSFLFANDGGYGPESWCDNSHPGDNDAASFDLATTDGGVTWRVTRIDLSFKGLVWHPDPSIANSRLEVFDKTHPKFYFSASKHHEYFNRDNDEFVSRYSEYGCEDDVNGAGASVLVAERSFPGLSSNNVGEVWSHAGFVDALSMYPGHRIWAVPGGPPDCFVVEEHLIDADSCGTNASVMDGTNPLMPLPVATCSTSAFASGFVWAHAPTGSYTASQLYSHNSTGAANTITWLSTGSYRLDFPGLGATVGGNVQVTAYGAGSERCKVGSWGSGGGMLSAYVNCFTAAGAPVDTLFTASYVQQPAVNPAAKGGYLWAEQPSAPLSTPYVPSLTYQWNSSGSQNTVERTSVGMYTATFPGIAISGGTVEVTAYGWGNEHCKVRGWGGNTVNVGCFTPGGAPTDALFTLSFAEKTLRNMPSYAYAWAEQPTAANYAPYSTYQRNFRTCTAMSPVGMRRNSTGSYSATIPGLSVLGSHAKVTAYGSGPESCKVRGWLAVNGGTQVDVFCHGPSGQPVDTVFVLVYSSLDAVPC